MMRTDAMWLATESMDMRAGAETAAQGDRDVRCREAALCLCVCANSRDAGMKALMHGTQVEPGQALLDRHSANFARWIGFQSASGFGTQFTWHRIGAGTASPPV